MVCVFSEIFIAPDNNNGKHKTLASSQQEVVSGLTRDALIGVVCSILLLIVLLIMVGLTLYYRKKYRKLKFVSGPAVHYSDVVLDGGECVAVFMIMCIFMFIV